MDISTQIETILFYKAEPTSREDLSEMLSHPLADIDAGITELSQKLEGDKRGIRLMEHTGSVMLATAPEASALIESIIKEELSRDLGKAASETLAIILYLSPIPRSRIDWIRGVNSTFILRNLMIRGLVDRISNPADERSFLYRPTFDLLGHLGVARVEEITDYEKIRAEIAQFEKGDNITLEEVGTMEDEKDEPSLSGAHESR